MRIGAVKLFQPHFPGAAKKAVAKKAVAKKLAAKKAPAKKIARRR